jgi:hypothetical protein
VQLVRKIAEEEQELQKTMVEIKKMKKNHREEM